FTAVGWGLPDDLRPLLGKGVTHTGRVDDVRPYLGRASVVVVPLRIGSGTRLKVLEALAMGKAVVSTKIGCEGLEVKHGEHLLIASDPAEFAKSVLRLMARPEDAAALGRRGRELVERRYGWDRSVARLHEFHESIFDARSSLSRVTAEAAAR
ncbi:MAG TPA: glycosyltransferase family 4 protein, partial [Candidatus Dormibacteraeota bacterium]|nr:glycosyltransferase family 4 protein [Candidatus Dormibacteraeota bacterium]